MKKLLAFIALAALALPAFAQVSYQPVQVVSGVTNDAATGTNIAKLIDCRKQSKVTIALTTYYDAASNGTNGFIYQRSVDGSLFEAPVQVVQMGTGTGGGGIVAGGQTIHTNIDTLGCGWIKINALTNWFTTSKMTNSVLSYGFKSGL